MSAANSEIDSIVGSVPTAEPEVQKRKKKKLAPRGGAMHNIFAYLLQQELIPQEEQSTLEEILAKPLPVVFRVHENGTVVPGWLRNLLHNFSREFTGDQTISVMAPVKQGFDKSHDRNPNKEQTVGDGELDVCVSTAPPKAEVLPPEELKPPQQLEWDPRGRVWMLDVARQVVRRTPALLQFKTFLEEHTEMGDIVRQEAVSMLPPLLLDVQPEHQVLDMCAAPGSKTTQLLEDLARSHATHAAASSSSSAPRGVVVANDCSYDRACLLSHRVRSLHSPCSMVVSHKGEDLPFPEEFFHRVLCDVPCSGDGTVRKSPNMKWRSARSVPLNCLQVQLCLHSLRLLKVGGLMTYSTCSMNPVENEAVLAEVLRRCGATVEIVDASDQVCDFANRAAQRPEPPAQLPGVARRPGVCTWRVQDVDKPQVWLSSFEEVPESRAWRMPSSLFRDGAGKDATHSAQHPAMATQLARCWRLYPHLQNTGGFFIALLRKKAAFPPSALHNLPDPPDIFGQDRSRAGGKGKDEEAGDAMGGAGGATGTEEGEEEFGDGPPEADPLADKYIPLITSERGREVWEILRSHYGIEASFPTSQLLVTSKSCSNVSFVSRHVAELVAAFPSLRLISAGVRLFVRSSNVIAAQALPSGEQPAPAKTRIAGLPGAQILAAHMTKHVFHVAVEVLLQMLKSEDGYVRYEQVPPAL